MSNVAQFKALLQASASDAVFHREGDTVPCPCLSPEGFRSPKWHKDHPLEPVCNEAGVLAQVVTEFPVKAFVQPAQSAAVRRLTSEYVNSMFGEVRADDHIGLFPMDWNSRSLNFENWSQAGEEFVMYDGKRFLVVNANKISDPADGKPHHWEIGLRLIKTERAGA